MNWIIINADITPLLRFCSLWIPDRTAPHRWHRSCGEVPCIAPVDIHEEYFVCDDRTSKKRFGFQLFLFLCRVISTCNACMDPGRDRPGQVSAMYLFFSTSRSFASCSSKPLAMASIKLWEI